MRHFLREVINFFVLGGRKNTKTPEYYRSQKENSYLLTEDRETIGIYLVNGDIDYNSDTRYYIVCHGKGTERNDSTRHAGLKKFTGYNAMFLVLDYRGFGDSTADFEKTGVNKDIETAYQFLQTHFKTDRISFIGHSYGSAVALEYLRHSIEKNNGMVPHHMYLFAPFQNLSMILHTYTGLSFLMKLIPGLEEFLFGDLEYDNLSVVEKFGEKTTIWHGRKDKVIPHTHTENMKRKSQKLKVHYTEDSHDQVFGNADNWRQLFKEDGAKQRI